MALPALALGALDEHERDNVLAHIDACPGCQQKLAQYRNLSQELLEAVPQRTPPPAIKLALMERVKPRKQSWSERIGNWLGGAQALPRWALAATFSLLIAALALIAYETVRLGNQQAAFAQQLAQQQSALALLSGDTSRVNMAGTQAASGASAVMRYVPQDTLAVVQTRDLPALSADKTYQLWLIDSDGKHDSGAVFTIPANSGGMVTIIVIAPRPLKDYVGCGVSIEPRGGSKWPTGPAALQGKLWS